MKQRKIYGSLIIASLFILLYLTSPVSADITNNSSIELNNILEKYRNTDLNEFRLPFLSYLSMPTGWFPGFLIVQLIKGIIALIIILLILFDIIEP